jgi:hypothetical protein
MCESSSTARQLAYKAGHIGEEEQVARGCVSRVSRRRACKCSNPPLILKVLKGCLQLNQFPFPVRRVSQAEYMRWVIVGKGYEPVKVSLVTSTRRKPS